MFLFFLHFCLSKLSVTQSEERSFVSWMRESGQMFFGEEYSFRLGIFLSNSRYVKDFNSGKHSFTLKLNRLAALTPSEYQSLLGYKIRLPTNRPQIVSAKKPNSDSLDWREKGAVNPIKNQMSCGSCWAFATTLSIESAEFLKYGKLYSLSEQSLVDCDKTDNGCVGGAPANAINYIVSQCNGKVMLENDYPYAGVDQTCQLDLSRAVGHVSSYIPVEKGNEDDLAAKCEQYGPVAIAIDSSKMSFNFYSGGIYDEPRCRNDYMDHAVGLIGYGSENGVQYWIVRNHWGTSWGENGYIRMIRGSNQCGEASDALVPIIA